MRFKRTFITIIALIIIAVLLTFFYEHHRSRASEPIISIRPSSSDNQNKDMIALLGDSWIHNESLDHLLKLELEKRDLKYNIQSFGEPGAFSKKIYENLNSNQGKFGAYSILESKPKYCIVIAGVNDAASQMGPKFYARHMELIVLKLLEHNIKPIIIELPEFGINEIMEKAHWLAVAKNTTMSWINNRGKTDNILDYRERLITKLQNKNLWSKIDYVPFDTICKDYHSCIPIYKDPAHLNDQGKSRLCKAIMNHIDK